MSSTRRVSQKPHLYALDLYALDLYALDLYGIML